MSKPDLKTAFGKRIRQLRVDREWSQEHMAAVVGLDRSYVGSVERGERNVSLQNIQKFAKAFGVSLSELLDFEHG